MLEFSRAARNPGTASTVGEARKNIRVRLRARRRPAAMAILDLSPLEQMKALDILIHQVDQATPGP